MKIAVAECMLVMSVRETMRHTLWRMVLLCLLCISPASTQAVDFSGSGKESAIPAKHRSNRQRVAEQLQGQIDGGDFYMTPAGRHSLRRLAGSLAIRPKPQTQTPDVDAIKDLSNEGGPLEKYRLDLGSQKGVFILKSSPLERQQQRREPGRLQDAL